MQPRHWPAWADYITRVKNTDGTLNNPSKENNKKLNTPGFFKRQKYSQNLKKVKIIPTSLMESYIYSMFLKIVKKFQYLKSSLKENK